MQVVFDVSASSMQQAKDKGYGVADTPKQLAAQCEVLITMLPGPQHVRTVYEGRDGILAGARAGSLFIDSSTIDPATARAVSAAASKAVSRAEMVDAPVSGGVGGAQAGTLTFMVGGSAQAFARAKPYLVAMGKNIVHCGEAGTGQAAKVVNNLVLAISMVGVSEGMALGSVTPLSSPLTSAVCAAVASAANSRVMSGWLCRAVCSVKLGMDPKKLAGILNTSSGRCWSSDTYNPCPGVMVCAAAPRRCALLSRSAALL